MHFFTVEHRSFSSIFGNISKGAKSNFEVEENGPLMCHCHDEEGNLLQNEPMGLITREEPTDTEWAYVFSPYGLVVEKHIYTGPESEGWEFVASIPLSEEAPDWQAIEDAGYARRSETRKQHRGED